MADTAPQPPADETPNQRQARLRREKRNAKILAEGSDRLNRITQLNGGVAPPKEIGMRHSCRIDFTLANVYSLPRAETLYRRR